MQDDEEEVPRHAEVDQEVDVQPDGIRGHERLFAHDDAYEAVVRTEREWVWVSGQCVMARLCMPRTYPTDEMRKKSVSTSAPPMKAVRSLFVSPFAAWDTCAVTLREFWEK